MKRELDPPNESGESHRARQIAIFEEQKMPNVIGGCVEEVFLRLESRTAGVGDT